jgi:Tol biopolymer transport system component
MADLQPVAQGLFGYDPVLSRDGKKMWFIGGNAAESGIWELALDRDGKANGVPRLQHNVPPGTGHYLAASGSGKRLAFVQMNTRDNLYSVATGKAGQSASPEAITRDTRLRKTNPGISPNGKLVCFAVAQIGQPNQVWIADMEGKSAQQIPVGRSAGNPAWLSDNELSYWTWSKESAQLWEWNIAEGRTTFIFDSGQQVLDFVRPSPNGRTAAFQHNDHGAMNVWSLSLEDKTVRQLTFSQTPVGWPAWSRNGKMLTVEVKTGAATNIGIMPAIGGPIAMLTHDSGQNWPYSWSPDGGEIAFAAFRKGRWNVFSDSAKSGAETQLTNYSAANTFVRYPEWSPTGERIVYEYGETTGNIWMLESR